MSHKPQSQQFAVNSQLINNPQQQQLKSLVKEFLGKNDLISLRKKFQLDKQLMKNDYFVKAKKNKKHNQQCSKDHQCTCGMHLAQIKLKNVNDPKGKFRSNYALGNQDILFSSIDKQLKDKNAYFFADKIGKLPQYSPVMQNLNSESSYKKAFPNRNCKYDKISNIKHLKLSNVSFGPSQIKNFESAYYQQFSSPKSSKTPTPFVTHLSDNLQTLNMKYQSLQSNYQNNYSEKRQRLRSSLKPRNLYKDINIQLTKESKYGQIFNKSPQSSIKATASSKVKQTKGITIHHLSSSFIKANQLSLFDPHVLSSYQSQFPIRNNQFGCPLGVKSSFGNMKNLI